VLVVVAVCLQAPATAFSYDAGHYWGGATALLDGGSVFDRGLLTVRGVLTSFLYLPAATVARVAGPSAAGSAVLVQNAVLVAVIGAVLLPRVVGIWRTTTPAVVWVCAVASALLLRGLAPFPLTDLWAAALLLAAVVGLDGSGRVRFLVAGCLAGVAFNVRPAVLIPLGLVGVAVLVARRWSGLWFAAGGVLALLPQFALNRWRGTTWFPWPEATAALTQVQAKTAAFVVRYDTVTSGQVADARLFFCSPRMAHALHGVAPGSTRELALAYLSHPIEASIVSVQKVGAALHWPLSTPYFSPAPGADGLVALLVTAVAVVGAAGILRATFRHGWLALSLPQAGLLLAWAGSLLTLTTSATETRFALPLILVGIAGCGLLADRGPALPRTRGGRIWLAATVVAVAAVFGAGAWGLQHPLSGDGTVARCAAS
jgi:hypothetical protein